MKRQMAELQKMMGAGQVPAMGGKEVPRHPACGSRHTTLIAPPPSTPTSTAGLLRRVVASGDDGPPAGAAGASGCTLFEEPQGSLPRQIQNSDMTRTGPPVRHQPVKQIQ